MKQSKVVGLTGSIATGKSAASNIIKSLGYDLIDADKIAREIINDEDIIKNIKENFGEDIYINNNLNREKLGKIIFEDSEKRKILNEITHPKIYSKIKAYIIEGKSEIIFLDIPLLIETLSDIEKYDLHLDEIWLIYVNRETQIKRLMERDNIDYDYALEKVSSQMSVEDKLSYADVVIDNSLTKEDLEEKIKKELSNFKRR
ncbi:dephospho-CoA kinase [Peptoniphilus stercorisuis]|uniref:Dephospho-CoA kinase n=1 Tax=Peptoniphilus stercorisuis TaxID=1436965 RepID=A0ABS4KAD0_9FIRM|nr:dephospho-CoA kinase [Peptoniphilus stercorisuis]MBP2024731.1 dephospho-CoA kinase [Peptoniphilus stercorisuis]